MPKKRIAWLYSGRFNGYLDDGETQSMLSLFRRLQERGADCSVEVISGPRSLRLKRRYDQLVREWIGGAGGARKGKEAVSFRLKGIPVNIGFVREDPLKVFGRPDKEQFRGLIRRVKKGIEKIRPDLVFTSQNDIISLVAASETGIPVFHTFSTDEFKYQRQYAIYRSEFLQALNAAKVIVRNPAFKKDLMRLWRKKAFFVPPAVDYDSYIVKKRENKYITFINYAPHKGGVIFWNIARKLPQKEFLITDRHGLYDQQPGMRNVRVVRRESDMRKIYKLTRILLVPSLCDEAYGRVIVEAMINGIPVIANKVGGISRIAKKSAFLIEVNREEREKKDYFFNPVYHIKTYQRYIELINALDADRKFYASVSQRTQEAARLFRSQEEEILGRFVEDINPA